MSEDQLTIILQAINDSRVEFTAECGKLSTQLTQDMGDLRAEVLTSYGRLDERVKANEGYISSEKKWGRIKTYALPAYAMFHAVLLHFGIRT